MNKKIHFEFKLFFNFLYNKFEYKKMRQHSRKLKDLDSKN